MSERRIKLLDLRFRAKRYDQPIAALDGVALANVTAMFHILPKASRLVWHSEHLEQRRLPPHFDDHLRLLVMPVSPGSVVAPIAVDVSRKGKLFTDDDVGCEYLHKGLRRLVAGYRAVADDKPLPADFPRDLVGVAAKFGEGLQGDDAIVLEVAGEAPVSWTATARSRLEVFAPRTHVATIDVSGRVVAVDLRRMRFQLLVGEQVLEAALPDHRKDLVVTALDESKGRRIRFRGRVVMREDGTISRVESAEIVDDADKAQPPAETRPFSETLAEAFKDVTEEDWASLPPDSASNLDHYLYGSPRKPE